MNAKELVKLFVPPLFIKLCRRVRFGAREKKPFIEWEYIPEGWEYGRMSTEVKGWNVESVLDVYKRKWPKFSAMTRGTGPLGIAHESPLTGSEDIDSHNTIMSFAYVLARAAHRLDALSMLDWGGGIGHYHLLAQALLPDVRIEYHCKDLPLLAEYGAKLFPDQDFCADDSCLERTYDLVMASSSMHYTEDWQELLARLARSARRYLYVTRLPTVLRVPSFVFIQRPYACGYNTEYLGWCLNRAELLSEAEKSGLTPVREFVIAERPFIVKAPEQCQYRGFLFRPAE